MNRIFALDADAAIIDAAPEGLGIQVNEFSAHNRDGTMIRNDHNTMRNHAFILKNFHLLTQPGEPVALNAPQEAHNQRS